MDSSIALSCGMVCWVWRWWRSKAQGCGPQRAAVIGFTGSVGAGDVRLPQGLGAPSRGMGRRQLYSASGTVGRRALLHVALLGVQLCGSDVLVCWCAVHCAVSCPATCV